jgi:hypothetical protein
MAEGWGDSIEQLAISGIYVFPAAGIYTVDVISKGL